MDPSALNAPEDEWDNDDFVIPSLGIEDPSENTANDPPIQDSKQISQAKKEESIYLGPHGAPPSQSKQDVNSYGRKQRFKQKLKDADQKISGSGRENKIENIRDLVGGSKMHVNPSKSSRDWLDPHCHESEFEKRRPL
ncbi:uncharacterized protein LOC143594138 [Bidens hawaiensis]|uniref:uncharacterized protein LOC143594138 n=1 Tax=Bidens hawaiensis TaxID=980011 RepID=UPI0040494B9B